VLNQPIMTGYLETFLLRPRDHKLVGNGTLRFKIPTNWLAVTVLTEEQNGLFPLGTMDSFYSDNQKPVYNFVPAAFAVGEQKDIVEIETNCGRLIYAYHVSSPSPIRANSPEALIGKAIFEYYCTVVGPLSPYNAYIAGMKNEWNYVFPGLYSFYGSHNRTMELGQSMPDVVYHPWEFNSCPFTTPPCNKTDYSGYGFPHKFLRAWISTGTGGLLFFSNEPDWFLRGGMSYYFQEMVMASAFGQHKIYERFQDLYNYYQTSYVQTGLDRRIVCSDSNEMNCSFLTNFKSGLWAFYLNQRILEATQGEKSIADLSRYLYATYAGNGRPLTIKEIQDAVNIVSGTDLSEVWTRYAYGNESLPLDYYFQDDDKDGLMNGLEIERHTDPKSADTNGNGIDDGVEYAMDCARTVLDPYYCVGIIPTGAKGSQLIPSITAMTQGTPHATGASDAEPGLIDLTNSAIVLDGLSSDWPDISPLATDPQETVLYDFKALYVFSDAKNLYLRIDPYGIFPYNSGPGEFLFDIIAQTDEGQSRFQVTIFPYKLEEVHLEHLVSKTNQFDRQKFYTGSALNKVFELIIPLEYLGYPKSVTIDALASVVEGSRRHVYDSFDPVNLTIGTNTAGTAITPISTVTSPFATTTPTWIIQGTSHATGTSDAEPGLIDLTNSAITLDGLSSDWPEISPLATSPQGTGPYDFRALYGFSDANYLYLRIDPYGIFPSNGPGQFTFEIKTQAGDQWNFQIYTLPSEIERVNLTQKVGGNLQLDSRKIYRGAATDQVFELIIPLEYLGYPKSVTFQVCVREVDQSTSLVFDSFDPVTLKINSSSLDSYWIVLILVGAGILIVAVFILIKRKH
jgi:hypothetical protein